MRQFAKVVAVIGLMVPVAGCAYKELQAPCAPGEGKPLAYLEPLPLPAPFDRTDACGPMRSINKGSLDGL